MIYAKTIVTGLNRFYRGHFQNAPNIKTFFGYASTDIFNSNITERYCDRPDRSFMNGIYAQVDELCLAEFASDYYKQYLRKEDQDNDNQPVILSDETLENHHDSTLMFPKTTFCEVNCAIKSTKI